MTGSQDKTEKRIIDQGGYWIPTLWVLSIVIIGIGGFMLGGADASPRLLASVQEALSNTFGTQKTGFVEIIDVDTFEPRLNSTIPNRIFDSKNKVLTQVVSVLPSNEGTIETPLVATGTAKEQEEEIITGGTVKLCSQEGKIATHELLINEVAWAGRVDNTSEEWIELRNLQGKEIDLSNWQLINKEGSIVIFFSEGESIDEYFLLRRILTRDDPEETYSVGGVEADKVYTGIIKNSDEALYLFNGECELIDEVVDVGSNWSQVGGSASPGYKSAERTNKTSWHTYSGSMKENVNGTPKGINSNPPKNIIVPTVNQLSSFSSSPRVTTLTVPVWCLQDDLNEPTQTVLINEIAWAGSASSTSQEWIELYTSIGGGLSLSNWQLLDKDGEIQIVFNNQTIEDYLLLKRILTSDDPSDTHYVGNVQADIVFTGIIQNDDETLRLFDASCNLVDEVVDVGSSWQNIGGNASPTYKSAERQDNTTWGTYLGKESDIMGTPKGINSSLEESEEDEVGTEEESLDESQGSEGEEDDSSNGEINQGDISLEITDIIFDIEGSDEGSERIVIANNGTSTVSLELYSIQYLKLNGVFPDIAKKNFEGGSTIDSQFIVGMNCSTEFPCEGVDMSWSQALGNDGGTVYIVLNQEKIEDALDPDIHSSSTYSPES